MGIDDPVGQLAGAAAHDVVGFRVDAHRERGSGVGDEVDPQDLRRQQRNDGGCRVGGVGQADEPAEQDRQEHRRHLTHVGAEQVAHELLDVVEDSAALPDGGDDGGVVVVAEDHLPGFLGHLGAGDAHRDPDVGGFQGGGVVDAVAGHGDDLPAGLQRVDDP